jgi:hypothetical protein
LTAVRYNLSRRGIVQKKKAALSVLGVLAAVFVIMQLIPVDLSNPPVESDMPAPADVKAILRTSCYDCHSNETVWPWYSKVAPVSWVLAHDAAEGREKINFSTWGRYTPEKQAMNMMQIIDEVKEGEMPPMPYTWKHAGSDITPDELKALEAWKTASKKTM